MRSRQTNKQKEEKSQNNNIRIPLCMSVQNQVLSHEPSNSPTFKSRVTAFEKDKKDQLLSNRRAVMGQWKDLDFRNS